MIDRVTDTIYRDIGLPVSEPAVNGARRDENSRRRFRAPILARGGGQLIRQIGAPDALVCLGPSAAV